MYSWSGSGTKKKKKVCIYTCEASESSEAELSTRAFAKERRKKKKQGNECKPQLNAAALHNLSLYYFSFFFPLFTPFLLKGIISTSPFFVVKDYPATLEKKRKIGSLSLISSFMETEGMTWQ